MKFLCPSKENCMNKNQQHAKGIDICLCWASTNSEDAFIPLDVSHFPPQKVSLFHSNGSSLSCTTGSSWITMLAGASRWWGRLKIMLERTSIAMHSTDFSMWGSGKEGSKGPLPRPITTHRPLLECCQNALQKGVFPLLQRFSEGPEAFRPSGTSRAVARDLCSPKALTCCFLK